MPGKELRGLRNIEVRDLEKPTDELADMEVGGLPVAGGIVGAGGELKWPNPTRPGDTLQVESEVLDLRPSQSRPDRGVAIVLSLTRNQRNEVVQR